MVPCTPLQNRSLYFLFSHRCPARRRSRPIRTRIGSSGDGVGSPELQQSAACRRCTGAGGHGFVSSRISNLPVSRLAVVSPAPSSSSTSASLSGMAVPAPFSSLTSESPMTLGMGGTRRSPSRHRTSVMRTATDRGRTTTTTRAAPPQAPPEAVTTSSVISVRCFLAAAAVPLPPATPRRGWPETAQSSPSGRRRTGRGEEVLPHPARTPRAAPHRRRLPAPGPARSRPPNVRRRKDDGGTKPYFLFRWRQAPPSSPRGGPDSFACDFLDSWTLAGDALWCSSTRSEARGFGRAVVVIVVAPADTDILLLSSPTWRPCPPRRTGCRSPAFFPVNQ